MEKEMGVTPLALRKRVTLKRGLQKFKEAFTDLSSQRGYNQAGVQSIAISEIESYLNILCEHRPEHRLVYMKLILEMDAVYMDFFRKKMESKRGSS